MFAVVALFRALSLVWIVAGVEPKNQFFHETICDGEPKKTLSCPPQNVILIVWANYGRLHPDTCIENGQLINITCKADVDTVTSIVQEICDDENSCDLEADKDTYGDPPECRGVKKYLQVYYLCKSAVVLTPVLTQAASKPNILFVLVDDFGWSDVGFHGSKIRTPNIDKLASDGVILDNYYVQPICTPTRAALLSGRYPIHLGLQHGIVHDGEPFGLPLNITTLPQKLKEAGYATHMIGKWHLGFYNWESTPTYRGFDSFFGFYSGAEDHYTHVQDHYLDLRDDKEIVRDLNDTYSVHAFSKRAVQVAKEHDPSKPLFLYMAFQNVHSPVQAPQSYINKYQFINDTLRRTYAAMVDIMDEAVGNITEAFSKAGLWDNTLMILSTDNGGIPKNGGYDYPLRGRKDTLWEGGIRGVGLVHGPMLNRKGVKCNGLMHVTDWYPTLVALAGGELDKRDSPLDGHDMWDSISSGKPSPRAEILHNIDANIFARDGRLLFGKQGIGMRVGEMKLLMKVPNVTWFVPPEEGGPPEQQDMITAKGPVPTVDIALYNITADPYERHDLSDQLPRVVNELQARVKFYVKSLVLPANKPRDPRARQVAEKNGAWTPWM